jgi:hypothetical protein
MKMVSQSERARLMVSESALLLKRFYFLQREFVRMQAGWLPGTEHWESKLLLPEFVWQDALAAQQLRQRVLELRYPDRRIEPGPDAPLLELFRSCRDAPGPLAFCTGLATVAKPAIRSAYQRYLRAADHLDDGPTVRILEHALADIDLQLERWKPLLDEAARLSPEESAPSQGWCRGLRQAFAAAGEHWATEVTLQPAPPFRGAEHGGQPFAIARRGVRDRRFARALIPWPDSLEPSRGPGVGFELQIRQAQAHLNEIWAAEMAAAVLFDLAEEGPPEFLDEAARWCYDEIRHCRMGYARFQEWGFQRREMPLGSFSYDAGADADPLVRLGIIYYFESTYIHTKSERTRTFRDFGDRVSSHDMDFDWADELIHAQYGKHWLAHFLGRRGDPRGIEDIKRLAGACIERMRAAATPGEREATETLYRLTMQRARELSAGSEAGEPIAAS